MALIAKERIPPKREQINIRLNPDVLEMLDNYCRFIESSQNYVVEQSLRYTFDRDRAFAEWLTQNETTGEKTKDASPAESLSRKSS
jgi:predicted transcriptional regulator